jgi:hypothetical protein
MSETRGRKKKWNDFRNVSFNTENYLIDALEKDKDYIKCPDFTFFMNNLLLKFLGGSVNAVEQFRAEHPEYS